MCSVNEIEDSMIPKDVKAPTAFLKNCMKCQGSAVILVRARDPMCRSCFLYYFTHKFRATLGKSKAIRQGEKVLIAFSGGPASCCLLHLIKEGLSEGTHKKLRFIPEVVFINEGNVLGWTDEKTMAIANDLRVFCRNFGFNVDNISLEKLSSGTSVSGENQAATSSGRCTESHYNELPSMSSDADSVERLKKSFMSSRSLTGKQDLLYSMRSQLLRIYAKEKDCTKIIVAETSTRLSIKLLSNIAQGRGGSLPFDVGVNDSRDEQVSVIRPMRELASKEVAFYNRMNSIEPIITQSLDTLEGSNASLQKQTEAFVTNLQADFPSTVSTIFRTGDKLTLNDDLSSTENRCVMCQSPISEGGASTNSCRKVVEQRTEQDNPECCGKGDGSCQKSGSRNIVITKEDVIQKLCYGCRLTFKDMGHDIDCLPRFVIQEFEKAYRRSLMKDSIQDFLLG